MPDTMTSTPPNLPAWARELVTLYESNAANQFILHGNVGDRLLLPQQDKPILGSLNDYLLTRILPQFDVILSYDLGDGLRVEKGGDTFAQWPRMKEAPDMPKAPNAAVEFLTHYFRYLGNLNRLGRARVHCACILRAMDLVAPGFPGGLNYALNALALLVRDWAQDTLFLEMPLATFLITENLNDLHPYIVNNNRSAKIQLPLPTPEELQKTFEAAAQTYPTTLGNFQGNFETPARQLAGATLASVETMLKTKEHAKEPLTPEDLVKLKKQLVERDCNGLIEFIESDDTLDKLYGQEAIKRWLKQDIVLWRQNDTEALPMGYLLCGPVGTGKTFMVRCLAGEAGVPVVKIKNFRDKWVGSSEGNLEKIFRLLHALGRCYVFIDEADQTLGKRDGGGEDSGVGGRLYSVMAEEMSNTKNRGKIIWVLASSRPDLIEVDLKRPGRIDVKIPIFPTSTPAEGFALIRSLCKRRGLDIPETGLAALESKIPIKLTPGAAEAIAVKVYRLAQTEKSTPSDALRACLNDYQSPVAAEVMDFQIQIAAREATDLDFVPQLFREKK